MNNVTEKTEQLIKPWIAARRRVERLRVELADAEQERIITENALGKWLIPEGADSKEVFNIWYGSGILQAQFAFSPVPGRQDYSVKWRREPDGKDRFEHGF